MISAWNDNTGKAKAKHPYRKCLVWKSESTNLENGGSFLLRLATPPPLISAHENNRDLKSPANTSASNRAKNDFIGLKFSLHVWQNRTSCTIKGNCLRKEKTIWTRKSNFVLKINQFFLIIFHQIRVSLGTYGAFNQPPHLFFSFVSLVCTSSNIQLFDY